jgi:amino acid transporter
VRVPESFIKKPTADLKREVATLSEPQKYFARTATGLTRTVGIWDSLMMNISFMALGLGFVYAVYAPALYPGVNLPVSVLPALGLSLLVGCIYYLMGITMPRSGGDYVWVSRVAHPSIGFLSSFWLLLNFLTYCGSGPVWAIHDGVSAMFLSFATITGNKGFLSYAQFFQSPNASAAIGILIVFLFTCILVVGTRTTFRIAWILFGVLMVAFAVYIITMLLVGHDTFIFRLQQLTGMNPDSLISAAKNAGYDTGFTLGGTALGSVYALLNFFGYQNSVYFAGEVKDVRKTQLYAIFGSMLIFAACLILFDQTLYTVVGAPLFHSMAFLFASGNPAYTLPVGPFGQTLTMFVTDNPVIIVLGAAVFVVTVLLAVVAVFFTCTRILFAWSFDRVIPTKFSELDKRFNSPYLVIITCGIVAIISSLLYTYTNVFTFFTYAITGYGIVWMIAGFTAMIFPFRRKDIFDTAPPLVRSKVGSMPVISALGLVVFLGSLGMIYASLTPAFTGAPIDPIYASMIVVFSLLGVLIYVVGYLYNRSKGIDLGLIFREVPPV